VSASGDGTHNAGMITWPAMGELPNGVSMNYTVTVTPLASGSLTNTVFSTATSSDPDLSNNNGTAAAAQAITAVYDRPTITEQRLLGGAFQLEFVIMPNTMVSVQASTGLVNWQTLITTTSGNGYVGFTDCDAPNHPIRFYRTVQ